MLHILLFFIKHWGLSFSLLSFISVHNCSTWKKSIRLFKSGADLKIDRFSVKECFKELLARIEEYLLLISLVILSLVLIYLLSTSFELSWDIEQSESESISECPKKKCYFVIT